MHFIRHFFAIVSLLFLVTLGSFSHAQSGTVSFQELAKEFREYGSTRDELKEYHKQNPTFAHSFDKDKKQRLTAYSRELSRRAALSEKEKDLFGQVETDGIFDAVVGQFKSAGEKWQGTFIKYAEWLFWTLFAISFTLQMCYSFLEGGETKTVFSQLVKYCITAGIMIFILRNGATLAGLVITSLQQIGVQAGGLSMDATTPSGIVDVGMDIFSHVLSDTSWSDVAISLVRVFSALANLLILSYVAIRFAVLIIMGWLLAYIGIITLGLAGLEQTKDVVGNYVKTIIGYGLEMMVFLLIVGVAFDISSVAMQGASTPGELGLSLLASLVMAFLTQSLPSAISALVTGSTIHSGTQLANSAKGLAMAGAGMAGAAAGAVVGATVGKKAGEMMDNAKKSMGLGEYNGDKMAKNAIRDDKVSNRANQALESMGRGDLASGGGQGGQGSDKSNNTFSGG